jgi:hypothetical protein
MADQGAGQSGGGYMADQSDGSQGGGYNSPTPSADLDDEIPF